MDILNLEEGEERARRKNARLAGETIEMLDIPDLPVQQHGLHCKTVERSGEVMEEAMVVDEMVGYATDAMEEDDKFQLILNDLQKKILL